MVDTYEAVKKFQKELNGGTAALVLLGVMNGAKNPMYGYQIAKHVEKKARDVDIMKQGALYPVLRSLESSGLLESEVEPSVSGPPRRYYRITPSGRQTLQSFKEIWNETRDFVDSVLRGEDDDQ
ncbi:PadR family transcriptional regulator [Dehalogenimonas etheniformans]|uniref:PadR family transcriptional regulator n=1 Tax=Dehalogenimonas etheniformans TaxID=1536648 RepID=A0A2P5P4X1_9CHLR|nr:PadR family transcriptional regulator [Dehalogenimonas etheniformans]PPD57339.1 PadR family transcriptional regulator [Dehalogenimonas etheniformans]QNT75190.1 PadR family transcriptional regulator [Dehalogenimonas etheniformans]